MQRTRRVNLIVCIAAIFAMTTAVLQAAIIVDLSWQEGVAGYAGTQDTFIARRYDEQDPRYDSDEDINNQNFGSATTVDIYNASVELVRIPLLRFDDIFGPGPGQIPPTAMGIEQATLTLYLIRDDSGNNIGVHRLLADWDEATATYNNSFGGNGVQTDGTDAVSVPDDTVDSAVGFYTIDVTDSVAAWFDGADNFGWAFIGGTTTPRPFFRTSEYGDISFRPLLEVSYSIPEPASFGLLLAGGLAMLGRRRRR